MDLIDQEQCGVLTYNGLPGCLNHRRGVKRIRSRCPIGQWGWVKNDSPYSRLEICRACCHYVPAGVQAIAKIPTFRKARVGFLACSYMPIGGTETWHQSLLSRLRDCGGFVCLNPSLAKGDFHRLHVETGQGIEAAISLANSVDVLVAWGIGIDLGRVLSASGNRPKVISVSHCDNRSQWTIDVMHSQAPWTDHFVYICPTGIETVPANLRSKATLIPNGPDPVRLQVTESREATRRKLGVLDDDTLLLVTSRLSREKRVGRLMQAVEQLGEGWQLRIAGDSAGWSRSHSIGLQQLQTSRVRIIDPVANPGNLLQAADGVLSASEYEGYGLASAEAMLAGVPVISTLTGLLEYDASLAAIVPHDAGPDAWSDMIRSDFADPDTQLARIKHAKQVMSTVHSVEKFAQRWDALIDHIRESSSDFLLSNSA